MLLLLLRPLLKVRRRQKKRRKRMHENKVASFAVTNARPAAMQ
jgi:hypothetical protein